MMNYNRIKTRYKEGKKAFKEGKFLTALKIFVKVSNFYKYYKIPPFSNNELMKLAKICYVKLSESPSMRLDTTLDYGVIMMNLGLMEESITYFNKVLEIDENCKRALYEKGCLLETIGEYEQACEVLNQALKKYPYEKIFLNCMGQIHEKQNKLDNALEYYNLSIDIDHHDGESYFNKGRILYNFEEFEEALIYFERAVEVFNEEDEKLVDVYDYFANTLFEMKKYREAEKILDKAISLFPKRGEPYYNKAEFFFTVGKENEALDLIDKAIKLSRPCVDFLYRKASYLNFLNKSTSAINCLLRARRIAPDDLKILDFLGEIYSSRGDYEKAIEVYLESIKIENIPFTNYLLSECFFAIKKYMEALHFINQYIAIDQKYVSAYVLRAKISAHTSYKRLAIEDLYTAYNIDKDSFYLFDHDRFYLENLSDMEEYQKLLNEMENRYKV